MSCDMGPLASATTILAWASMAYSFYKVAVTFKEIDALKGRIEQRVEAFKEAGDLENQARAEWNLDHIVEIYNKELTLQDYVFNSQPESKEKPTPQRTRSQERNRQADGTI